MSRSDALQRILDCGIVAVVRSPHADQLVSVARALLEGGICAIEITMTVPDAMNVIRRVAAEMGGDVVLGAGTILDTETARAALLAGAEYIVSPILNLDVIRLCKRYGKPVMPGAFTPTEILSAWDSGADIVKVFPADVGGPAYLKSILAPLPQLRLMPTGGVDLSTAADFLRAGACCLGVGSSLVDQAAIRNREFGRIRELAERFASTVRDFRAQGAK
jgi:2-dehydro-3-deoxyphosphogluconate aldolase/(4S)-4-hydroxy-2-oxoglutarate aldolase